jgi:hypothetical protein
MSFRRPVWNAIAPIRKKAAERVQRPPPVLSWEMTQNLMRNPAVGAMFWVAA